MGSIKAGKYMKLLCREPINSKVLLYSRGNYIQYPATNYHEKDI